jgi:hypothetical protein
LKKWYKVARNVRRVGEQRSNKLEKVFEKCESLEVKMGVVGRIGSWGVGRGWDCTRGSSTKMEKGNRAHFGEFVDDLRKILTEIGFCRRGK